MSDEFIRREDAIETAVSAFNAWNLAMAAADGQREINLVFRRKELCKAVELVFRGAPAADVAEVVRCRACKYRVDATINANGFLICDISDMEIAPDDFCSYGEYQTNTGGNGNVSD